MHKRWVRILVILLVLLLIAGGIWYFFIYQKAPITEGPRETVRNFLKAAMEPVGRCLYVYGGGWDEHSYGAAEETKTVGVSPNWEAFFDENDETYDFERVSGHYHDGLDCSAFIGYAVYQVFEDAYSDNGYVVESSNMPENYAKLFSGEVIKPSEITEYRPGDIMGIKGHVGIAIGTCEDGSLLFVHASPPVVSLCGTPTPDGNVDSQAVALAEKYMKKYFPECSKKYENWSRGMSYLTKFRLMRWNREVLADPDGFDEMTPEEILHKLFET